MNKASLIGPPGLAPMKAVETDGLMMMSVLVYPEFISAALAALAGGVAVALLVAGAWAFQRWFLIAVSGSRTALQQMLVGAPASDRWHGDSTVVPFLMRLHFFFSLVRWLLRIWCWFVFYLILLAGSPPAALAKPRLFFLEQECTQRGSILSFTSIFPFLSHGCIAPDH